jgi:capsular exopolysaccharide synthesis family protein
LYSDNSSGTLFQQVQRYRHLFLSARWYLIAGSIVLAVAGGIAFVSMADRHPELPATALIGVDNKTGEPGIKEISGVMQAQSPLLMSRTILRETVKRLSLSFVLDGKSRAEIADSIIVDSAAASGTYRFALSKKVSGAFALVFVPESDIRQSIARGLASSRVVVQGNLHQDAALVRPGVRLVFSKEFKTRPFDFSFRILGTPDAVEALFNRIEVKDGEAGHGTATIMLSVKGTDYALSAQVVNDISDEFVKKNLGFRKRRTEETLVSLKKQLDIARNDLFLAETQLREFRTVHPTVGISENLRQRVTGLADIQDSVAQWQKLLDEAKELHFALSGASPNEAPQRAEEAASFLIHRQVAAGTMLLSQLERLAFEGSGFERNYAADHPLTIENKRKLQSVAGEVANALQKYIWSCSQSIAGKTRAAKSLAGEVEMLPMRELQLAQLDRRLRIASEIYSTVLNSYNQVRASSAGEVAEVFVLDYAVPPVAPPVNVPKLLTLFSIAALMLLIMPLLIWNALKATVSDEEEFVRKTGKSLLESIPRSGALGKNCVCLSSADSETGIDTMKQHGAVHEIFRSMRTKVMFTARQHPGKSIVVTSLEPSVGKSTIAANLAAAMAAQNVPTLIVDADLRCGMLHEFFTKKQFPGLSDYLDPLGTHGTAGMSSILQPTFLPNLFFVSSGVPQTTSSELLSSDRFRLLKKELSSQFAHIIIDAPPLGPIIDAAVIDPYSSLYLVVARAGVSDVSALVNKIAEFKEIEKNILGYILNFAALDGKMKYYKYARYYTAKTKRSSPAQKVFS